jgi:hypothetical protein
MPHCTYVFSLERPHCDSACNASGVVDFSWELVRGERDNVKNRSLLLLCKTDDTMDVFLNEMDDDALHHPLAMSS